MSMFRQMLSLVKGKFNIQHCQRFLSNQISAKVKNEEESADTKPFHQLAEHRFVYPEFLPNPKYEFRNKIREKLEREDMLKRRSVLEIPEFYVGSILAVTCADPYAPGKESRFVGICILRTYDALRATFTLRNIVDKQGVEVMYDMYNPMILLIEVLKLEKRLDENLLYLRDAPHEYSYVPFDMEPEYVTEGQSVNVNTIKVKLNPPPWTAKWEQRNLQGVEGLQLDLLPKPRQQRWQRVQSPWERYDLMKEYRRCIPEEDQAEIWQDVESHRQKYPVKREVWKRTLLKAKPKKSNF